MGEYEKFVKTTDLKVDADDDIQFYLDGYNEEHGEVFGVIKRMRRGDYDKLLSWDKVPVSRFLILHGLKNAIREFDKCRSDLLKEIGDEHWYLTRFIQTIGLNWDHIEQLNMIKLKERQKKNLILGKGSEREQETE